MKINKILPTPSLNKIWSELTKITNKLITLEELVMNNATSSEIFENARQRIVNSALGKALGLSADTSVLDAAIEIESVEIKTLDWKPSTATTFEVEPGYYSGGTLDSSDAFNAGKGNGIVKEGSVTKQSNALTVALTYTIPKSGNYILILTGYSNDASANYQVQAKLAGNVILATVKSYLALSKAVFYAEEGDTLEILSGNTYYAYNNTTLYKLIHIGS